MCGLSGDWEGGGEVKELMSEKKAIIKSNLILTFRNYGREEKMHSGAVKVFILPLKSSQTVCSSRRKSTKLRP